MPQVYVRQQKSALPRPEKELKGFSKIFLQPGESKPVQIILDESAFTYFDDHKNSWILEQGAFDIMVGSASNLVRMKGTVNW